MRQVTAAVIIENGLLFLTRRGPAEHLPGMWELPGGKLEPAETPQQCLERELAEELEMRASAGDVLATTVYHYDHGEFEMLALSVDRLSDFRLTVHDAACWVTRSDAEALTIAPADVELIAELGRRGIW